jgi:STE24 endopeptidase
MLGLFAAILVPYWFVAMTRTRPASEAERRTLRSALGGAPRVRVRVVEDTAWVGNAVAAGILPTQRYVFVATSVFGLLDDEQMAAVVAHEVAHHRRRHVLLRHGLAIAALGYVTALAEFAPWQLFPTVVLGTVPYLLVTRWVVRRTELAADTVAARTTTPDALADALERLVDNELVLGGGSSLGQFFAEHPAVSVRLQRLRESAGDRRL